MNTEQLSATAMKDAISEVLETMFFTLPDFEGDVADDRLYSYESHITLHDPKDTRMGLSLKIIEGFARMITANFLGKSEADILPEDVEDTLKELTNMLGGNYIARVQDRKWKLGIPSLRQSGKEGVRNIFELPVFCFEEHVGMITLHSDSL